MAADSATAKRVEIGFAIGPLRRATAYRAALERVAADGFRVIRGYEPFRPGDGPGFAHVIESLRYLDSLGFTPYFDISDYPFELAPSAAERASGPWPFTPEKRASVFAYNNIYPPSPERYDSVLTVLLSSLESTFGREKLRRWWFEIGNEPDAKSFFWGSAEQFDTLMAVAIRRFHGFDPQLRVGGGAFSTVTDTANKAGFMRLARQLSTSSDQFTFVSVHIYAQSFHDGTEIGPDIRAVLGPARAAQRVISEWNADSRKTARLQAILGSDEIVPYLIDVLAASYDTDVHLVLAFKLMDDPGAPQLGFFDSQGHPKSAYTSLLLLSRFAGAGFSADTRNGDIVLRGDSLVLVHAVRQPVPIDRRTFEVVMASVPSSSPQVPAGGWAVLRRR